MNPTLRNAAVVAIGAGLFTAPLEANASYLGYGNGDPGNWDFWTEQHGGPRHAVAAPAMPARRAVVKQHRELKRKSSDQTHS